MFEKIQLHWIVLLTSVFLANLTNLTRVPPFTLHVAISDHEDHALCLLPGIVPPCTVTSASKSLSLPLLFLESLGNYSIYRIQLPSSSFFLVDLVLFLKKIILGILFQQTSHIPLGFIFPWLQPWLDSSLLLYVQHQLLTSFALCLI